MRIIFVDPDNAPAEQLRSFLHDHNDQIISKFLKRVFIILTTVKFMKDLL